MKLRVVACICMLPLMMLRPASAHGDAQERISRLTAEIKTSPSGDLYFRRGRILLEHGDAMAALADFQMSARLEPGVFETALLKAEAFNLIGKPKLALKILDRYLEKNPAATRCLLQRARILTRLGETSSAIRDYRKVLSQAATPDPDLLLETSAVLEKTNRATESLKVLDQGIARLGHIPSLVITAVDLELQSRHWNAALRRVALAQTAAPRPEPWMARRASILARSGRLDESRAAWKALLAHLAGLPPAERQSLAMSRRAREASQALAALSDPAFADQLPIPAADDAERGSSPPDQPVFINSVPANGPLLISLTRGPYLQQAAPTSIVVRWRTDLPVAGRVNIGPEPGTISRSFDETDPVTDHAVKLTGLAADTIYYYSIGWPDVILEGGDAGHSFTTPPVAGTTKDTRIWVLGDAGTNNANQRNVRDAFYNFTGLRSPDLCLLLGDNAYNSGTDPEYQAAIFDTYSPMLAKTPFWSCLGNHDTAQSTSFEDNHPYFDIFTFPTQGEAGGVASGTEHYYSFNYGNIHFIALDSMTADRSPTGAMATWLTADLASTTATWIVAFFHHPPYTKGSHDSDLETELIQMRENFLPILEDGGVDLVLGGHSHSYERSYLLDGCYGTSGTLVPAMKKNGGDGRPGGDGAYIKPLTGPRDHFGAVYNVTGSAGKVTSGTMNHPGMFFSVLELGSVVIDINGPRLDSTFLRDNGTIRDTYTILKQGAADSDADGMPDAYELSNGLDRHDPGDAALDNDGDGTCNLDEYVFGRPASVADVSACTTTLGPATATITFPTAAGRSYRVLWSETLMANDWHACSPPIAGTGADVSWTDDGSATPTPPGANTPRRFYRVEATAND